jgi:hypothetical protein
MGVIYHSDSSLTLKFSTTRIDLIGMDSKFLSYEVVLPVLRFVSGEKNVIITNSNFID